MKKQLRAPRKEDVARKERVPRIGAGEKTILPFIMKEYREISTVNVFRGGILKQKCNSFIAGFNDHSILSFINGVHIYFTMQA